MVEFGGWTMPVQYSTILEEHQAVRERVGLFDVSHMGRLWFEGPGALDWLEQVTTNRVASLVDGQIQYSLIANERGGVRDDVLVSRRSDGFLMVCNASNREKVVGHLRANPPTRPAELDDRTLETAMIAIQGPAARATLEPLFDGSLEPIRYYHHATGRVLGDIETIVSRTGYTGEDGFELIVPVTRAEDVWRALMEAGQAHGILPCGLGARDTLRFEAAMPLYGHELSEEIDPFSAGLEWAVKLGKGEFIGREALRVIRHQPRRVRVGLALAGKRIARQGSDVVGGADPIGVVTSGTFSPTLQQSLAMALVGPAFGLPGTGLLIHVRGHREAATVVPLPFYRRPRPERR
jgi:aminomethyltransferase